MTNLAYPMLYIARREKGHTQEQVARELSISKQRYGLKELGKAKFFWMKLKFYLNCMKCQLMNYLVIRFQ